MIKAKVIKSFYYAKDKEIYLDEERFKELQEQGYVEEIKTILEIASPQIKEETIEKAIKVQNGKKRVLPK